MKKQIATALVAATLASLSFGAMAAPMASTTMTKTTTTMHKPMMMHTGMHEVCKVVIHAHHKVKTCTWMKNKPTMMKKTVTVTKK